MHALASTSGTSGTARRVPTVGWAEAPHLLEELYNLEDALVCAQYLHAFVRHADIVKVACIAQIVNVIAPVLTRPDGLLIQTIYWPFQMLRDDVTGDALRVAVRAPELATGRGDVPVLDVAATFDATGEPGASHSSTATRAAPSTSPSTSPMPRSRSAVARPHGRARRNATSGMLQL